MLFSNFEFFLFFGVVFFLYWYVLPWAFPVEERRLSAIHIFLLIASYVFYMSWDWRFGGLILISTYVDFLAGRIIHTSDKKLYRILALNTSLIVNLIFILGFFKYYNFLSSSLNEVMNGFFGFPNTLPILDIILPVGVSFYTFQSLSYTIDIYRKVIESEKSFIKFALFVSFFPQLVAGPIVTAKTFLPQLSGTKKLEDIPFRKAIRYFLMGYFKKVILSDNVSPISDLIYSNPGAYSTEAAWLAAFLFWVQVYCDFSGYTDMAYSVALLLGFELPENFRMPYISRSITEHWRRWHITLSTWLRDYVYISMGGSRAGVFRYRFNLWFTMFVGGVWHGANWTFVVWGSIQGGLLLLESFLKEFREKYIHFDYSRFTPFLNTFRWIYTTFLTVTVGTCFRSDSLEKEWILLQKMFIYSEGILRPYMLKTGIPVILIVFAAHWIGYFIFEKKKEWKIPAKIEFALYPLVILLFSLFTPDHEIPFIYFQF
ncbi:MAG: MBOAT family protein [Leptospira sp.]|nr:MBOAT family protein [Leptospira sp.]